MSDAMSFRHVRIEDKDRLLAWRNDPSVWKYCINARPVTEVEHQRWFAGVLKRTDVRFFILTYQGTPAGQIRFDLKGSEAVVSIAVDLAWRGKAIGLKGLQATCREVFRSPRLARIVALVHRDNTASMRFFEKAGFSKTGAQEIDGHFFEQFVLQRKDSKD